MIGFNLYRGDANPAAGMARCRPSFWHASVTATRRWPDYLFVVINSFID
jgi:hypothetical protein